MWIKTHRCLVCIKIPKIEEIEACFYMPMWLFQDYKKQLRRVADFLGYNVSDDLRNNCEG